MSDNYFYGAFPLFLLDIKTLKLDKSCFDAGASQFTPLRDPSECDTFFGRLPSQPASDANATITSSPAALPSQSLPASISALPTTLASSQTIELLPPVATLDAPPPLPSMAATSETTQTRPIVLVIALVAAAGLIIAGLAMWVRACVTDRKRESKRLERLNESTASGSPSPDLESGNPFKSSRNSKSPLSGDASVCGSDLTIVRHGAGEGERPVISKRGQSLFMHWDEAVEKRGVGLDLRMERKGGWDLGEKASFALSMNGVEGSGSGSLRRSVGDLGPPAAYIRLSRLDTPLPLKRSSIAKCTFVDRGTLFPNGFGADSVSDSSLEYGVRKWSSLPDSGKVLEAVKDGVGRDGLMDLPVYSR
ncbi:hypothetical protein HDU97_006762 [Phlyctochytrium planicorne]|nr:hypothetical protein HDU97_006762 [Phlyctochytrium planicorne]